MSVYIDKSGKFYDGKISKPHYVSVIMTGSILRIYDDLDNELASWSLNSLIIIERPTPPNPAIIGHIKSPDARLYIENERGWKYIQSRIPKGGFESSFLSIHWSSFIGYGVMSVAALWALFTIFPKVIETSAYIIPPSWEKSLGQYAVLSMTGHDKTCSSREGQAILNKLTEQIQTHLKRKIKYNVRVIKNSNILNAFAAPGGYIVLYSSIIEEADSPEEVVGVLAHEMSHVELYHTTKAVVRNLGLYLTLSSVFGERLEEIASLLSQMSYSRNDEMEADYNAQKIMVSMNMNPAGLQYFFKRMKKKEWDINFKGVEFLDYLSSHPNTDKRIEALTYGKKKNYKPALSEGEWNALRSICSKTKTTKFAD